MVWLRLVSSYTTVLRSSGENGKLILGVHLCAGTLLSGIKKGYAYTLTQ